MGGVKLIVGLVPNHLNGIFLFVVALLSGMTGSASFLISLLAHPRRLQVRVFLPPILSAPVVGTTSPVLLLGVERIKVTRLLLLPGQYPSAPQVAATMVLHVFLAPNRSGVPAVGLTNY